MALPDVIALTRTYLLTQLATASSTGGQVPVLTRVPRDRPPEWLQIRRAGGGAATVQDIARLDVFAWAVTEDRANAIGSTARAALWALAETSKLGPMCYRVAELMGPRMVDDDETGTPQLWFTIDLHVRADELIHKAAN